MASNLKILYVSSEIDPFVKTGSLAEVAAELPKYLKDVGHDIRLFIPKYGTINDRRYTIREVIRLKGIEVPLANKKVIANVKSAFLPNSKVQVYFVENKNYFDRVGLYSDPETNKNWEDNAEHFIFFNQSIFSILKKLHWQPDIIHCNDWQTALIPFLLKHAYNDDPFFNKIQTVLTIHDLASQGVFDKDVVQLLGKLKEMFFENSSHKNGDRVNFLKSGILYADSLNTMSKHYAKEIRSSEAASFGLQKLIKKRAKNLTGITRGIDYSTWDPEGDTHIHKNYTRRDIASKNENRRHLVESHDLTYEENTPIIGAILDSWNEQEMELLSQTIKEMLKLKACFIFAANGAEKYDRLFNPLVKKFPDKIAFNSKMDKPFVHQLVAGSDMIFSPCRLEPCGSTPLCGLRYGAIPIAYFTGAVADTIKNFNPETNQGNGFVFKDYSPASLLATFKQAVAVFSDKIVWKKLVSRAMKLNFSWQIAADNYNKLYHNLVN